MTLNLEFLKEFIKPMMSDKRFEHSLRTAEEALRLSEKYSINTVKPCTAAILHDVAREWPSREIIQLAEADLPGCSSEQSLEILHGRAGARFLAEKLGMKDQEILDAVRFHSTGSPGMSETGMIVFAADYMEAGRSHINHLWRKKADHLGLNQLILYILDEMLEYFRTHSIQPERQTMEFYRILKEHRSF